ncbi:CsbD family protein [Leucobacter sp.]
MSAEDKIKNAVQDIVGKVKETAGKATGDDELQREGRADQTKADLKQAGENVKDALK